jgi:hypothetical protein
MAHQIQQLVVTLTSAVVLAATGSSADESRYKSLCDASAGIALDARHFVVADDEHDILRIFRTGIPDPLPSDVDLRDFLKTEGGKESDLEGAARIGERIYWISSHGRNSDGDVEPGRYRLFATDIKAGSPPQLVPVAKPYSSLLEDMVNEPELAKYKLSWAATFAAEEPGGLGIEGLAATKDGSLLIGFRNPVRGGKALLVPLLNAAELSRGEKAKFGQPIDLDLGGRGIRSIERVGETFWIVAGQTGDKKKCDKDAFAVYRWSGKKDDDAKRIENIDVEDFSPEAIFAWPDGTLQVLSDDGDFPVDGKKCKRLKGQDAAKRSFRSFALKP